MNYSGLSIIGGGGIFTLIFSAIGIIIWWSIKRLITRITEKIDGLNNSITEIRIDLSTKYVTKDDLNHEIVDSKDGRKNIWQELKKLDRSYTELNTKFDILIPKSRTRKR